MTRSALLLAALAPPLLAQAAPPAPTPPVMDSRSTDLDLLRPEPGGSRIYVQATLPDGEPGLFLVDTGAAISTLSSDTAERLGLAVHDTGGFVSGLGGQAPLSQATVDRLTLGDAVVHDVSFAVGVRGVPERAGMMPLDGILGNNVWSLFDLELDYRADLMVLHRKGTMRVPRRSEPLFFDGSFVYTPIVVHTGSDAPTSDRIVIQLDTGAGELLLSGPTGEALRGSFTEGLETIRGIGASETLPPSRFQQRTRRVPLAAVELGGRRVDVDFDARWLNYDQGGTVGPDGLRGLAGHELFDGRIALFDYADGRFALKKSRRPARQVDGHQVLLDQDMARYGDDPSRTLYRARLYLGMSRTDEARALLEAHVADHPDDAGTRVLLAAVLRHAGEASAAREVLTPLTADELVEQEEIVTVVNGLLLDGEVDEALRVATAARDAHPDVAAAQVALADALLASGDPDGANRALLTAARLEQYPDAFLVRRARAAMARGDRLGAMAHLRKLLQLYPSGGPFLWFYATLLDAGPEAETFRSDMRAAMARLHPQHRPIDFQVAAHAALGEPDRARELMREGIARDCDPQEAAVRDNCTAWYMALARTPGDEPLERIERALAAEGPRSDFLDTKAMVHLVRGELSQARDAAREAARMSPGDWYMLWQADRIAELADEREARANTDEARGG